MAESSGDGLLNCFIVGFTGETGKELVNACVKSHKFNKIVLIGRRTVELDPEVASKCQQAVVDFENIESSREIFQGLNVGYCCLGTTRGKSGKAGFIKVDHDYTMSVAEMAKSSGVSQFHYVSSQGANKNSWFLYPRIKGQVEDNLANMGFKNLFIYRPAFLQCEREESRILEKVAFYTVIKPVSKFSPATICTPTSLLASAMLNCTAKYDHSSQHILSNKMIYSAAEGQVPH